MRHFARRILHAADNHGIAGSLRRLFSRAARQHHPGPADFADPVGPHPFDLFRGALLTGADTSGYIPGEQLQGAKYTTSRAANRANTAYYAISPSTLWAALLRLPSKAADATFVDLGCGKGRALLVANACGFNHIAGIELDPGLVGIARANTAGHPGIGIHTGDAAAFPYPPGPLLVFLYHPFLGPMQRRVLRNLARQLAQNPRPCWLLRANPDYPGTLRVFGTATLLWDLTLPFSPEDAAADRHGILAERYTLHRVN